MTDAQIERGPATLGRLMASEDAAVDEFAPESAPEVAVVVSAEVDALDGLTTDARLEAEANLRVLIAEQEQTALQQAHRASAADTLRALGPVVEPDVRLVDG